MKKVRLRPILDKDKYAKSVEQIIKYELYQAIFKPIFDLLNVKPNVSRETRKNNAPGSLERAIEAGHMIHDGTHFIGKLSAEISSEIQKMGGKWDKKKRAYKLKASDATVQGKAMIARAGMKAKFTVEKIEEILLAAEAEHFQLPDLSEYAAGIIGDLDKQLDKTLPADLEVGMAMSGYIEEKLRETYVENMNLYVKEWKEEQIIRLREVVQDNAAQGYRADRLIGQIQAEYEVTERKAKFLARNETSILVSKYREENYKEAGVKQYEWSTSGDRRVRKDHQDLDGKIFDWDHPPVVDKARGVRAHPGEYYGCRCVSIPIITVRG